MYTDEHGEAFVKFLPYVGLYLQNDTQYRCNVKPGLYGEADIQATAHYPDQQPLWDGSKKSNTLRKVAHQLANKTLVCIKKPSTESEAFCVETVVDFNGDPIEGVEVRLSTSGNNAQLDAASTDLIPPFNTIGQGQGDKDPAGRWIELVTNQYGQVGIDRPELRRVCRRHEPEPRDEVERLGQVGHLRIVRLAHLQGGSGNGSGLRRGDREPDGSRRPRAHASGSASRR